MGIVKSHPSTLPQQQIYRKWILFIRPGAGERRDLRSFPGLPPRCLQAYPLRSPAAKILLNVYRILADEQVQGRKLLCSNKSFANAQSIATYFSSDALKATKAFSVVIACVAGP